MLSLKVLFLFPHLRYRKTNDLNTRVVAKPYDEDGRRERAANLRRLKQSLARGKTRSPRLPPLEDHVEPVVDAVAEAVLEAVVEGVEGVRPEDTLLMRFTHMFTRSTQQQYPMARAEVITPRRVRAAVAPFQSSMRKPPKRESYFKRLMSFRSGPKRVHPAC